MTGFAWMAVVEPEMTTAAWIFVGAAWTFVIGLAVFCFAKVLGGGSADS